MADEYPEEKPVEEPDMWCPVSGAPVYKNPTLQWMSTPMMRGMMNGMMKITKTGDCTYPDVSGFMVPKMFNPEDKEKWATFEEQRPYCVPGYVSKAPKPGDVVPDGKLLSLQPDGPETTLLSEAKKLAASAGSKLVVISFDSITCPFWRAYGSADLHKAAGKVPTLHVYIREAHPKDEFGAGPNSSGPIALSRDYNKHKTVEERRASAQDALSIITKYTGGPASMFIDTMDDALEAAYEARPWRQYVIEAESGKLIDAIGLTPFNMAGKIAVVKKAVA